MEALGFIIRGLLVALGRMLGQLLRARREVDARRRELRLLALVDAWRKVERFAVGVRTDGLDKLDEALADIQLFGTASQVERAAAVARSINDRQAGDIDALVESLRSDLREELQLDRAVAPFVCLRATAR